VIPKELPIALGAFIERDFEFTLEASPSKYPTPSSETTQHDQHGSIEEECQPDYGRPFVLRKAMKTIEAVEPMNRQPTLSYVHISDAENSRHTAVSPLRK